MFGQAYNNVVRTLIGTVGAVALSTVVLFAAAGPAKAGTEQSVYAQYELISVSTARPIVY